MRRGKYNVRTHLIRFVLGSDDILHPNYGRSAIGAERPLLFPHNILYQVCGIIVCDRVKLLLIVYYQVW